jgi:hypothetical protein
MNTQLFDTNPIPHLPPSLPAAEEQERDEEALDRAEEPWDSLRQPPHARLLQRAVEAKRR